MSLSNQYSPFLHSFMFPYFSKSPRYRTQVNNGRYVTIVVTRQFPIVVGLFDCRYWTAQPPRRPLCYPDSLLTVIISAGDTAVVHRYHRVTRSYRCHCSLSCTPAATLSQVLQSLGPHHRLHKLLLPVVFVQCFFI